MHVNVCTDRAMLETLKAAHGGRRTRGPWLRLLSEVLSLAGPQAEFLRHSEKEWTSATFSGARHQVALAFAGPAAIEDGETFIELLPEHEFNLPGQLVADATVISASHEALPAPRLMVEVELLILDDA